MKKAMAMKKATTLFLSFAMLFACAACTNPGTGDEDTREQLATPTNLDISASGLITWNKVENAESYLVTVGTNERSTSQRMYQVEDSNALLEDFTYSVVAQADGYRDSEPATRTYTAPEVTVSVSIDGNLRSGGTAKATATVTGATNKAVTWSVVSGSEYVSISADGTLTAQTVTENQTAVIRATSVAKPTKYGERTVTVLTKTNLTQGMIDAIAEEKAIEFFSTLNIDLYTIGSRETYAGTQTAAALTAMDGEYWYTSYLDPNTNSQREMYYKKGENGIANQVTIGFNNDEIFYPVTDDLGDEITWEVAGFYNSFDGLSADNFTFDEDAWLWKYTGSDKTISERLVAAANPFKFTVKDVYLLINGNEIMGIQATSEDDYSLSAGYVARMTLQSTVNTNEVSVPKPEKFESDGEFHPRLAEAIENMQALENYTVEFCVDTVNVLIGNLETLTGFDMYITENVRYYKDFNFEYVSNTEIKKEYTGAEYGYKKISDNLYNTFELHSEYTDESHTDHTSEFVARHAYPGDFAETKPSFAFAAEIFDYPIPELYGSAVTYYATYSAMWPVATTFYKGYDHNDEMYGIFSTALRINNSYFVPYVTVENIDGEEYITEAAFAYNMGDYMYGVIYITYSDFGKTELPEPPIDLTFTTRQIPTSWTDGFLAYNEDGDDCDFIECAEDFFWEGVEIPFFNEVLGDNFGFAAKMVWEASAGSDKTRFVFSMYYDVPLDMNYSIESSMRAASKFLIKQGYTRTSAYRFTNGELNIAIVDNDLDLFIYIWETGK